VSQYGDTHYKDRLVHKVKDGYLVGAHRDRSTFYREFSADEIDAMLLRLRLKLVKSFPFWKNQARLYEKA